MSLHHNGDNSYFVFNGKEISNNGDFNLPNQFCLQNISNGFGATESREVSIKGNVYHFSADYNAIDFVILKIYKYLMVKNNIK